MYDFRRLLRALTLAVFFVGAPFGASAETVTAEDGSQIERFGNWGGRCNTGPAGEELCHVFVDVRTGEERTRAVYFGIGKQPAQGYISLTIVPLGTLLTRGVAFKVDEQAPFKIDLQTCLPGGCQSTIGMNAEIVQQLKAGNNLVVEITDIQQGPIQLSISLAGMTAAIAWLDSKHPN
jgi:invasion protein IalB